MENEMEKGEDNMINKVNEDNGKMAKSNKEEKIPEILKKIRKKKLLIEI